MVKNHFVVAMPPEDSAPQNPTPSNYQRTTGGNLQWKAPTVERLQQMLPSYEVIEILGMGGMGAVYKARQISLDRLVAIKILPPEAAGDEEANFVERFKNEARTMAKMNHPAIVHVYDFGETSEGQLYIVMEFIDGTDVSKMILSQGKLPPDHALAIVAHVCDALQYAHTHGVIHRDIKPANVLINMEGAVKVADFGLAKAADAGQGGLTKTNMAMGTPDFVAPEALIAGMIVDGRADLYAVGVMLYQMLTGNVPRGAFRMPSSTVKTDPRFDKIIIKSMEMDREMRYQTAFDIRKDLDVILTTPHVEAGGQSSAAIPKQSMPQKPVAKGPQKPMGKSANVPVRSLQGTAVHEVGQPERGNTPATAPAKKSNIGPILGITATVVIAAGMFFILKGGSKPDVGLSASSNQMSSAAGGIPQLPKPVAKAPASLPPPTIENPDVKKVDVTPLASSGAPSRPVNAASILPAADPPTSVKSTLGGAKRYLFDGRTFSGWTVQNGTDPAASWKINGRELSSDQRTILWSPESYGDYELELEWKMGPRGNGGVFYHVQGSDHLKALEMQLCDPANAGGVQSGGLYGIQSETHDASKPLFQWNTAKLVVRGTTREHWINGEKVCAYDVGSDELRRLAAASKIKPDIGTRSGRIALQANGGPVFYRNITLRTLDAESPAPKSAVVNAKRAEDIVNLLTLVNASHDKIEGDWKLVNGELKGGGPTEFSRIAFDVPVPEEYDFRVRFTRSSGGKAVAQHVPFRGRDVMWLMGGFGNKVCGLEQIGGKAGINNPTTVSFSLENNRRYESVVKVRRDRIQVEVDGKLVMEHKSDGSDLSVFEKWKFPDPKKLGVGCQQDTLFHSIEVIPFTGSSVTASAPIQSSPIAAPAAAMPPAAVPTPPPTLNSPPSADPRLAQLAAGFKARYDADAQKPFDAALAALNQSYVANGIGRARAAAQQKGALEEVTTLDAEKARILKNEPLPPADLDTLPASLKGLRATYRNALAKIEADRAQKAAPLYDLYLGALDAYIAELTKANKIDEAQKVKTLRDDIAAQKPQIDAGAAAVPTGNAPRTAVNRPGTKPASGGAEDAPTGGRGSRWYEAARWVVSVDGHLRVDKNGKQFGVSSEAEIPPGRFDVIEVTIDANPKSASIKDDDFTRFSGLKLRYLRLVDIKITDAAFAFLPTTPDVERILLDRIPITDAVLTHIAPLKKLTDLQLLGTKQFTGTGLERLASLSGLKTIWFSNGSFNDTGMKAMAGAINLEYFRIDSTAITDEGLAAFGPHPKLTLISMNGSKGVHGTALAAWEGMASLNGLGVSGCSISADFFPILAKFTQLTQLDLDDITALNDETLAVLAPLTKLENLSASGSRISGTGFAALRGMKKFQGLGVGRDTPITAEGLAAIIDACPMLERLTLGSGTQIRGRDFSALAGLKLLNKLDAPLPSLDDVALAEIAKIPAMDDLYIPDTAVTAAGIAALKPMKNLTKLRMHNCKNINDAAIPAFKDLKRLKELDIRDSAITDAGVATLRKALPGCKVTK